MSRHDMDALDAFFSRVSGEDNVHDAPSSVARQEERLSPIVRTSELLPGGGPGTLPPQETATGHQIGHTRTPMLAR